MKAKQASRKTFFISIGALLFLALIPFPTTICPAWHLQVLDKNDQPFPYANASQIWRYYSLEEEDHIDDQCSDSQGRISFPKRTFTSSLATRAWGAVRKIRELGIHASIGSSAYVLVSGPGYDNHLLKCTGTERQCIIRLTEEAPDEMFPHRKRCP